VSQEVKNLSDEALVLHVKAGDEHAFRALALRHGARYRALAFRFLGDMAVAEDLVQEGFVKLWTSADRFDATKAKFTTWFHRVIVNKCLDEKRKRHLIPLPEGYDVEDGRPSAEEQLGMSAAHRKIMAGLAVLSDREKTAVTLSYFDGLSNKDAADVMLLNVKAYESLLVRARTKMRQNLMADKETLLSALG